MITIVSDIHLTDGSSGDTINERAFHVFIESLRDQVFNACLRERDGDPEFVPIERCDIILLGDIFDVIRSDKWIKNKIRPWGENDKIADVVKDITTDIITNNSNALQYLSDLQGKITIRDANEPNSKTVKIPLYIHYYTGNHDWFYHVPGTKYNDIRQIVVDAFALANNPKESFPHVISESSDDLKKQLKEHRVYIQHGDIKDEFNYEGDKGRDHSSLGDCIVVELLNRFPQKVSEKLGLDPDNSVVKALKEIDNVRPLMSIPEWIDGILIRYASPSVRKEAMKVWDECVDNFLDTSFVKDHDRPWKWDTVDTLESALRVTRTLSIRTLSKFGNRLKKYVNGESYVKYAIEEEVIRKRMSDYVVYGHTHRPEIIPIDIIPTEYGFVDQIYFNTGTWRRVHQRCKYDEDSLEFVKYHVMTFHTIYKNDERNGRKYESWTGQLG